MGGRRCCVLAEGIEDLLELFRGPKGQIDEEPFAPLDLAATAARPAEPLVANMVSQPLGGTQGFVEEMDSVHGRLAAAFAPGAVRLAAALVPRDGGPATAADCIGLGCSRPARFDDTTHS